MLVHQHVTAIGGRLRMTTWAFGLPTLRIDLVVTKNKCLNAFFVLNNRA